MGRSTGRLRPHSEHALPDFFLTAFCPNFLMALLPENGESWGQTEAFLPGEASGFQHAALSVLPVLLNLLWLQCNCLPDTCKTQTGLQIGLLRMLWTLRMTKILQGGQGTCPRLNHSLHRYEDLSLNPQNPHNVVLLGASVTPEPLGWDGRWRQKESLTLMGQVARNTRRPCLKRGGRWGPTPEVVLWPCRSHTCIHSAKMCAYTEIKIICTVLPFYQTYESSI